MKSGNDYGDGDASTSPQVLYLITPDDGYGV